ncbi:hypothetical protein FE257_006529 [Aspergillus nanangensis]|uniref:Glycoside hydrolase family 93 protein n=1 Tax=Aspergillus nanangensis TaxID=2582783 RepID=A0AAD4GZ64_ASPNN|nr:hypothetical protein FE257_006529 [Aspergillus nanangensis]
MKLSSILACSLSTCMIDLSGAVPTPFTDFTNSIIWYPAADAVSWHTLYARPLQLPDESLIITWENYPLEPPLVNHPILRSVDGGATWTNYSAINDQVNGWGMRFQPFLYTLPQQLGDFPAGTILASGVSSPSNLTGGVYIELYASVDNAQTFDFVSHIAWGAGPQRVSDGSFALWEPFLTVYENQLVCFFSDSRDPSHSQKLSYATSSDLRTWSDEVDAVVYQTYEDRPGMPTVAYIATTGRYILTYEYCGAEGCGIFYRLSTSPLTFSDAGDNIVSPAGTVPSSLGGNPYMIWTEHPDQTDGSGLLILSAGGQEEVYLNDDAAGATSWRPADVGMWSAYSRGLSIISVNGRKKLQFANGGNMGDPNDNSIATGIVEVPT